MIFLHELGHFIAARWAGIEVEEFGFGLPSKNWSRSLPGRERNSPFTPCRLAVLCAPKARTTPTCPGGLAAANPWKRLVVLFAGPADEFAHRRCGVLLPDLVSKACLCPGQIEINSVMENSPAEQCGHAGW
ncbi:MAG: site-2 protease family protein [Candidatus Moduliflexus flocculans]|nr:site-2 protease family protein [Candidatus Moduliflexus flocculans]